MDKTSTENVDAFLIQNVLKCANCEEELITKVQCRKCRQVYCQNCCYQKQKLLSSHEGRTSSQQVMCNSCYNIVTQFQDFVTRNSGFSWNAVSLRGETWMRTSGAKKLMDSSPEQFDKYVALFRDYPIDADAITKDVQSGRSDPEVLHWELQEILYELDIRSYREDVTQLLEALVARNRTMGYCQGMNYLAIWSLLFLDKQHAFWLLTNLLENILTHGFYMGQANSLNGFFIESAVIGRVIDQLITEVQENPSRQNFSDLISVQPLIQMFVDVVDVESCMFIWDMLACQGSIALVRTMTSLVSLANPTVLRKEHPHIVLESVTKNRVANQLRAEYTTRTNQITERQANRYREEARDTRANEWQQCKAMQVKKLEKFSNFSQDEIQKLNIEFLKFMEQKRQRIQPQRVSWRALIVAGQRLSKTDQLDKSASANLLQNQSDVNLQEYGINKNEFLEFIAVIDKNMEGHASRLFDLYDEDLSGYLDFRELVSCLSVVVKGTFEEKLRMVFDIYDIDGSGYLTYEEITVMLNKTLKNTALMSNVNIDAIIQKFDLNSDGFISFKEFYGTILSDPILSTLFTQQLNPLQEEVSKARGTSIDSRRSRSKPEGGAMCFTCEIF